MRRLAALVAAMLAAPVLAQVADPVVVPTPPISPTGQPLGLGDDQTRRVDLGFTFDYFGQSFTQAWVSSNGFVSFLDGNSRCCEGLPIDAAPRNTIFGVWTDLIPISGPNPFGAVTTEDGLKAYVATWYRQNEYFNGNTNTFQIVLREDGTVSIRYDDVNLSDHRYLAGLTGPTVADQYQISYGFGRQIDVLDGNTYNFFAKPIVVDCAMTPLDPACFAPSSSVIVTPVPSPVDQATATPVTTTSVVEDTPVVTQAEATVESAATTTAVEADAAAEEVESDAAETVTQAAAEQATPATAEVAAAATETVATTKEAAKETKAAATTTAQAAPPPLPPGFSLTGPAATASASSSGDLQVGASSTEVLLANVDQTASSSQESAQAAQATSQQAAQGATSTEQAFAAAFGLGDAQAASGGPVAGFSGAVIGMSTDTGVQQQQQSSPASDERQRQEPTSFSSPTRVLEALNSMSAGAVPSVAAVASSGPEPSALAGDQSATINEMGFVPGFAAYAQVTIPDRPFYPPVVIYRRNRPVDANLTMYRLLQSNSRTWDALVESQYER